MGCCAMGIFVQRPSFSVWQKMCQQRGDQNEKKQISYAEATDTSGNSVFDSVDHRADSVQPVSDCIDNLLQFYRV